MPLNRPNGGFQGLPYSRKMALVETNCTGCPCFMKIETKRAEESEYGCSFPRDIEWVNSNIREPYLTVSEIAGNTCEFWKSYTKWELETVDTREGNWNDPATVRRSLRFISLRRDVNDGEDPLPEDFEEIIPQMQFSGNHD